MIRPFLIFFSIFGGLTIGVMAFIVLSVQPNLADEAKKSSCGIEGQKYPIHTAAHEAVWNNQVEHLRCLLKKGGHDMNALDSQNMTIMARVMTHYAPNPKVVKLLLVNGAKPYQEGSPLIKTVYENFSDYSVNYEKLRHKQDIPFIETEEQRLLQISNFKKEALLWAESVKHLFEHGMQIRPDPESVKHGQTSQGFNLLSTICQYWGQLDFKHTGLLESIIKHQKGKALFSKADLPNLTSWISSNEGLEGKECYQKFGEAFG